MVVLSPARRARAAANGEQGLRRARVAQRARSDLPGV
jgi:hypothetical protein